ncbi:SHOCT domain-containing protein [Streptomyces sp. NPDC006430]|uniref:SHOCT domain-containing protein n=1 Tax=Streptomyces sp. NPDC006430 TaxID=3154299 RepID=UPI0033ADDA78
MYWYDHGMGAWGWLFMSFSAIVFVALIVIVTVLLFRNTPRAPQGPQPPSAASAEQLLAERFARGEIDDDEYQKRLTTLRRHGAGPPGP